MFHPTVFDNLKVVLEGAVYDRDLDGEIVVTHRADVMDMAAFARFFQIDFCMAEDAGREEAVTAQIQLRTTLGDLASEQLEQPLVEHVGCTICLHFLVQVRDVPRETELITGILNEIWGERPHITQLLSARLDEHKPLRWPPEVYKNRVTLDFHRKIDEGNIADMRALVEHCVLSVARLREALFPW